MFETQVLSDARTFEDSDYYLPNAYVDRFSNEVQRGTHTTERDTSHESTEYEDRHAEPTHIQDTPADPSGDPTDGTKSGELAECVKNWKSAAAEEKKRMWSIFEETGIFASACRHGIILWITDMIRSGEL